MTAAKTRSGVLGCLPRAGPVITSGHHLVPQWSATNAIP
jgi:hypothetical protein